MQNGFPIAKAQTPWLELAGGARLTLVDQFATSTPPPPPIVTPQVKSHRVASVESIESEAIVEISSKPSGATLKVDGNERGKTPISLRETIGWNREDKKTLNLELSLSGYHSQRGRIELRGGDRTSWNPTLEIDIEAQRRQPIDIPDKILRSELQRQLGKSSGDAITIADLATITEFNSPSGQIADLTGLEHCTNIAELILYKNEIVDISPLQNLKNITELKLYGNPLNRDAEEVIEDLERRGASVCYDL